MNLQIKKLLDDLTEYAKANPNAKELTIEGKVRIKRYQGKEVIQVKKNDRWMEL